MSNPFANTIKFFKAINLLASPQGTTIKGLMEGPEISRRSVFRLLEAMGEFDFPLYDEQPLSGREKRYRLVESYVIKLPNMFFPNPMFIKGKLT